MVRWMLVLGSVAAIACGYSEDAYLEDEAAAACEFTVDCYPGLYENAAECIVLRGEAVATAGCAFDAAAARDCVDGLEALSCPDEGAAPAFPLACDSVYGDCGASE